VCTDKPVLCDECDECPCVCEDICPIEALAKHKTDTILTLEEFVNALDENDFTLSNWERIEDYLMEGIAAINVSETKTAVDVELLYIKQQINAVPITLAAHKTRAIAELRLFAYSKGRSNFTLKSWDIKQGYVNDGITGINVAANKVGVNIALETAKEAVDSVQSEEEPIICCEMENQIKRDAQALLFNNVPSIDDVFLFYYGTFNGSVVLMIYDANIRGSGRRPGDPLYEVITKSCGEVLRIRYNHAISFIPHTFIQVWNSGNFYRLTEAYNNGFLTGENLMQIARFHRSSGGFERFLSPATIDLRFSGDRVIVSFNRETTFRFPSFTIDDFPELHNIRDIRILNTATTMIVRNQITNEALGKSTPCQRLIDHEIYTLGIVIRFYDDCKQGVLDAIRILERRPEVIGVTPNYYFTIR